MEATQTARWRSPDQNEPSARVNTKPRCNHFFAMPKYTNDAIWTKTESHHNAFISYQSHYFKSFAYFPIFNWIFNSHMAVVPT